MRHTFTESGLNIPGATGWRVLAAIHCRRRQRRMSLFQTSLTPLHHDTRILHVTGPCQCVCVCACVCVDRTHSSSLPHWQNMRLVFKSVVDPFLLKVQAQILATALSSTSCDVQWKHQWQPGISNISRTPFRLTPCGVSLLIPRHLYALVEFHQQIFELDFMLGIQIIH